MIAERSSLVVFQAAGTVARWYGCPPIPDINWKPLNYFKTQCAIRQKDTADVTLIAAFKPSLAPCSTVLSRSNLETSFERTRSYGGGARHHAEFSTPQIADRFWSMSTAYVVRFSFECRTLSVRQQDIQSHGVQTTGLIRSSPDRPRH